MTSHDCAGIGTCLGIVPKDRYGTAVAVQTVLWRARPIVASLHDGEPNIQCRRPQSGCAYMGILEAIPCVPSMNYNEHGQRF